MTPTIVQDPSPVLRATASPVPTSDFGSAQLASILADMKAALAAEDDGVAIAAPQIGVSLQIFIVAAKALGKRQKEDIVFINPKITRLGRKREVLSEGCLSVRWKYGMVKRALTASVRAYNEKGNEFVMKGEGLLAQIFQHETDHLRGILFIDKATDIEDLPPPKKK
ncbi:peptide deformylase [Candidatus Nomurabacteria bacterium]|nr:peptide deformylase [Candidatus Nomurabacteria bacterium]